MPKPSDIPTTGDAQLAEDFLKYLSYERLRAVRTTETYGPDITAFRQFIAGLDPEMRLADADRDVVRRWLESIAAGHAPAYVSRRLSAIRMLYRYLLLRGVVAKDPTYGVRGPRIRQKVPQFFGERELDSLLDTPGMWDDTYNNVRARTIILLLYATGLRAAELLSLDDSSADIAARKLKFVGKGNKERIVPFGEELARALAEYKRQRDAEVPVRQGNALFVNPDGSRMVYHQLRREVMAGLAKVSTSPKRSPHTLRHSYATALVNHDAGIEETRQLLGHASVGTTARYTHVSPEQLMREYRKAHPRS